MHVSKKDHENCNRAGKKHVFYHEKTAYLNRLIDDGQSYDKLLKIKHLICLCKL